MLFVFPFMGVEWDFYTEKDIKHIALLGQLNDVDFKAINRE